MLQVNEDGVPNHRAIGEVTLTKQDADTGEKLNGVVYTLSRRDRPVIGGYLLETPIEVTTGKTYTASEDASGWHWKEEMGAEGTVKVAGLSWGEYTLAEKTELSGYVKSDTEYRFAITRENFKQVIEADGPVTNAKNHVTFRKTDNASNPQPLAGAVFEVHAGVSCDENCHPVSFYPSADGKETVTSVISGPDGTVTVYGLPTETAGDAETTYHLVETTAPEGYTLAESVLFTIDRNGRVQVAGLDADAVWMQDAPIALSVEKTGETEDSKLSGAQFRLTDVCTGDCDHKLVGGGSEETLITGENGQAPLPAGQLIAGHTYRLEETKAPEGYECTAVVTFTVHPDGRASLISTAGGKADAVLDEAGTTIQISDEKIRLQLTKVNYDDPETVLGNVVFTLL